MIKNVCLEHFLQQSFLYPIFINFLCGVFSAFNGTRHPPELLESWWVYLTFKNSPERNSPGLLILLQWVLFRGSQLLQMFSKAQSFEIATARNVSVGWSILAFTLFILELMFYGWEILQQCCCINCYHYRHLHN